jgi:hypothetical protein
MLYWRKKCNKEMKQQLLLLEIEFPI